MPEATRSELEGPTITVAEAAAWTGRDEDQIIRFFEWGQIGGLDLGGRLGHRLAERSVGTYFGLELPGPRELEIAAEKTAAEANKLERRATWAPRVKLDHWLYWFYDDCGDLLYIGITSCGVRRMEHHGAEKTWWPRVSAIRVDHFSTRDEAEAAERIAIRSYAPRFNGTFNLPKAHCAQEDTNGPRAAT